MNFVAIDLETAVGHDSICAVGIVVVENAMIIEEYHQLIQPPGNKYTFHTTKVHGLTSADTATAPTFPEIYPEIKKRISGKIVVAHKESFDRNVLKKTMLLHGFDYNELLLPERWKCTVQIYRQKGFNPCDLKTLSNYHKIELNHHEALSDARACAKLYLLSK